MKNSLAKLTAFLTPHIIAQIIRVISLVMIIDYVVGFLVWYGLAKGLKDPSGTPLGADFISLYAAGKMVQLGYVDQIYNWTIHQQVEQSILGYAAPYCAWLYPPVFLLLAVVFSYGPYLWAFALYIAAGFWGYWCVMRRLVAPTRGALLLLTAFPGVFCNISNGQNGFITTILLGMGLIWLEKKPWLSGLMLGLLIYKPQFFFMIPVVLAAGGHGKALLSTLTTALGAMLVAWFCFGSSVWLAFFAHMTMIQHTALETGFTGWHRIQSVFSSIRMWGGSLTLAYAVQALVAIGALCTTLWIWSRHVPLVLRASALCSCILLVTPYVLDYDLVLLAIPLAYFIKEGASFSFNSYEKGILVVVWCLPLWARWAGSHGVSLTPPVLIIVLGMCASRSLAFMRLSATQRQSHII